MLENEGCKILWDFPIQTDKVIKHRRLDIVCTDKIVKNCLIIDIAIHRRPEYHCERTIEGRQVPRLANRTGETMETKG